MADNPSPTRQLQDLLAYPREDLGVEIKSWLDLPAEPGRACLAQAFIALANHGGGQVVIGFSESSGVWTPASPRPASLAAYSQDEVNGIVAAYCEPSFHCEVSHVAHPVNGETYPIVTVPGGMAVPVRAKRDGPRDAKGKPQHVNVNTYYIRRPGPCSEAPRTGQEWDALLRRCVRSAKDELVATISRLLSEGATVAPVAAAVPEARLAAWTARTSARWHDLVSASKLEDRFKHGTWSCHYLLEPPIEGIGLADLREAMRKAMGNETGWPAWWMPSRPELEPYVHEGLIECWLKDTNFGDAAHSDFWAASPDGSAALVRGYQEDGGHEGRSAPGAVMDLCIPVWRTGECLLHAARLTEALGVPDATVRMAFKWTGLKGRALTSWSGNRFLGGGYVSRQDEVTSTVEVIASRISAELSGVVQRATQPLYETFSFFKPPASMIAEELQRMRKGI